MPIPAAFLEHLYANGFYAALNRTFVPLSNAVPFALGDLETLLVAVVAIVGWIAGLRRAREPWWRAVPRLLAHTAALAAAIVIAFNLLWGWNYRRAPIVARVDYVAARVTPASVSAFADRIASILNDDVGPAHERMRTESAPAMRAELARDFLPIVARLGDTWTPALTVPKTTLADRLYEMAGVGGQYDPFAFETLLNASFLPFEVPRALAHEWSHAAGFGDEGDANLIGTLTCLRSSDPLIRYSGAYWTYGELPASDRRRIHLAPAVIADFNAGRERFLRYYNPRLFTISWKVYDRYLRANGVTGGVVSYSRFLQLLVGTSFDADGCRYRAAAVQEARRPVDRPPHVGRRAVVPAQAFFGLAEIARHDVAKRIQAHRHRLIEGVDVVDRDQARGFVPLVRTDLLVGALDVRFGLVVGAEKLDVEIGIRVAVLFVRVETQHLVRPNRPAHFFGDVRFEQLRAPIAVIAADEHRDGHVVHEARHDDLLIAAGLERVRRALQQMRRGRHAKFEEVEQRRLVGHLRQPRVGAHVEALVFELGPVRLNLER